MTDKKVSNGGHSKTEDNEWYTPLVVLEKVRSVMGTIHVDPCTCEFAQSRVKAAVFYTKETDGLAASWVGKVWMNPPYGKELPKWVNKLEQEIMCGHTKEAVVLVNAATETKWAQKLFELGCRVGFTTKRIAFDKHPDDKSKKSQNTKGQMFVYIGSRPDLFEKHFADNCTIFKTLGSA